MPNESIRVTVDTVVLAVQQEALEVLLVKRKYEPFKNCWALPGGFLVDESDETIEKAAERELLEETNVGNIYLEQLYTFGDRGRDPRGRIVTVAYLALVRQEGLELRASSDASGVAWWPVMDLPDVAFDHKRIVEYAHQRLRYKIEYSPAAFMLLPEKFRLRDLQSVYEAVLGRSVDNRNFRKKFLNTGALQELNETSQEGSFGPRVFTVFRKTNSTNCPTGLCLRSSLTTLDNHKFSGQPASEILVWQNLDLKQIMSTHIQSIQASGYAQSEAPSNDTSSLQVSDKTFALTAELLKKIAEAAGFSARFSSANVIASTVTITDEDITASLEISKNAKPNEVALRYSRETWLTEESINSKSSQTTEYIADSRLPELRAIVIEFLGHKLENNVQPFKISIDFKQATLTAFIRSESLQTDSQSSSIAEERKQIMPAETIVSEDAVSTGRVETAKYATYSKSEVDRLLKAQAEAITASLGGKIARQSKMFQEAISEQQKLFAKSIDKVVQNADEFRTRLEASASTQHKTTSDQMDKFNAALTKELEQFKSSITKSIVPNIKTIDERLKAMQPGSKDSTPPSATTNTSSSNNNIVMALLVANIIATLATAAAVFIHH